MPAQSAVAPAAAIFNIVLSLVCHPGAHKKTAARCTIGVDLDQFAKALTKHLEIAGQFHRHKKSRLTAWGGIDLGQ
jgi:hypothetical protein